jgi:hypothetical protein
MRFGWGRWGPAPKVLGAKHISDPDVAPLIFNNVCVAGQKTGQGILGLNIQHHATGKQNKSRNNV